MEGREATRPRSRSRRGGQRRRRRSGRRRSRSRQRTLQRLAGEGRLAGSAAWNARASRLAFAAALALASAAGPGASAVGVARSVQWRARAFLLRELVDARPAGDAPTGRTAPAPAAPAGPSVVRQTGPRDCGPAALATVLAWRGRPSGLEAVLREARLRGDGASLSEMARLAAAFELPGGWFRVPAAALPDLPVPFIAHLGRNGGHYVAVLRVRRGFVLYADPARGMTLQPVPGFRRTWSRRVFLFEALAGRGSGA